MTSPVHLLGGNALPRDAQPRPASAGEQDSQRLSWQREMERAQSDAWFKPQLPSGQPSAQPPNGRAGPPPGAPQRRASAHAAVPGHAPWQRPLTPVTAAAASPSSSAHASTAAGAVPHTTPSPQGAAALSPSTLGGQAGSAPSARAAAVPLFGSMAPRPANTADAGQQPPLRVHAEWQGDTVRLWLGLDASLAGDAEQLAAHVHGWLRQQGLRALSVVCNGQVLHDATATRPDTDRRPTPLSTPPRDPRAGTFFDILATREF